MYSTELNEPYRTQVITSNQCPYLHSVPTKNSHFLFSHNFCKY